MRTAAVRGERNGERLPAAETGGDGGGEGERERERARSWGKCGVRPTLLKRSPQISVGQTFWGLIFCLLFQNTLKTNLQVYFS